MPIALDLQCKVPRVGLIICVLDPILFDNPYEPEIPVEYRHPSETT